MADFPAMPLWTDAYLADTRHLSDAEHGRYLLMLMDMWRMPEKRFPNDDAWLSRKFGRSGEDIQTVFRPLITEFFKNDGNWITHKRITREWKRLQANAKQHSDAAKARWNKHKQNAGAYAENQIPVMQPQPYPESPIPPTPTQDSTNLVSEHPPQGGDVKLNGHAAHAKQGTRLTEGWRPSSEAVEHCKTDLECSTSLLKQEFPNFQCHFLAATGASARKIDWDRTFINWMRRARRDEVRYEQLRSRRAH